MYNKPWETKKTVDRIDLVVSKRLVLVGEYLSSVAKANSLVDKGFLKSSNYSRLTEPLKVRVGNSAFYAIYIEKGTGEYAENGQGRKGGWFYTTTMKQGKGFPLGKTKDGKYLYHTHGMHPKPFIRPLLTDHTENIMKIMSA